MIEEKYIKEEFLSDIRFWVKKRLLVKVAFIEKIGIADKEVVEKQFLGKEVLGKEVFWDKKSAFDFISWSFQESQLES